MAQEDASRENDLSLGSVRPSTWVCYQSAVVRVIMAMREHMGEPLSLRWMAARAQFSEYHFHRLFNRVTGITPSRFLSALRIERAKHLLLTTDRHVTDICFEVGYNSLGSFTSQFSRFVGVSPRGLRRVKDSVHLLGSLMAELRSLDDALVRDASCIPRVEITVRSDSAFDGLIFVGLFPTPIPQGWPVGCAVLPVPGRCCIGGVPDGSHYVRLLAIPGSASTLTYLLPDCSAVRVSHTRAPLLLEGESSVATRQLTLDPVQATDPPILTALPVLLAERLHRSKVLATGPNRC
jgi:AraC family transcriptional regulator